MRCYRARKKLPLLAAGDLPESESCRLNSHLSSCAACRQEAARLQRSMEAFRELATADQPPPLPADFAWQVLAHVTHGRRRPLAPGAAAIRRWRQAWRRLALRGVALGSAALAVLMVYLAATAEHGTRRLVPPPASTTRSEVNWSRKIMASMDEPERLDRWRPSGQPGLYAILQRPDAANRPDTYVIAFCGESPAELSADSSWLYDLRRLLSARVTAPRTIYVVEYPMPGSSHGERQQLRRRLVRHLRPQFNQTTGV
jgi:hypothetical protein